MSKIRSSAHVKAPIVTEATEEGLKPLRDFITMLEMYPSVRFSRLEAERLETYFKAWSQTLEHAKAETEPRLTEPSSLRNLFNAIAVRTRNTLISSVMILPLVSDREKNSQIFSGHNAYKDLFACGAYHLSFGFFRVVGYPTAEGYRSCVTVPCLEIEDRVMDKLKDYQPLAALQALQNVMTFVNHDMLHHMTMPLLTLAAGWGISDHSREDMKKFTAWRQGIPQHRAVELATGYEGWAHVTHEKTLLAPAAANMMMEAGANVSEYFSEVRRIRDEMLATGSDPQEARKMIDYMNILMGHVLSRLFQFGSPMMQSCFEQMEKTDLAPEKAGEDCYRQLMQESPRSGMTAAEIQAAIENHVPNTSFGSLVASYKTEGIDILPSDGLPMSYAQMKMLQLMRASHDDVALHIPAKKVPEPLRADNTRHTLSMLELAREITGFKP